MNRVKFIDRMSQGRISRRDVMRSAAAFGIGMTFDADPVTRSGTADGHGMERLRPAGLLQIHMSTSMDAAGFLDLRQ